MFFVYFISLLLVLHGCLYLNLRRVWSGTGWQWWYLAVTLLVVGTWFFPAARRWLFRNPLLLDLMYLWIGFLIMMCAALLFRECLSGAARLIGWLSGADVSRLVGRGSVVAALVGGVLLYGYGLYEARAVRVREVTVKTGRLPEGMESLRLVFLSDVHITPTMWMRTLDGLAKLVNGTGADILMLGGDFVDGRFSPVGPQAAALRGMRGRLGKAAVLGNHELYSGLGDAVAFIEGAGFDLLRGEGKDYGGVAVVGLDDPQVSGRVGAVEALKDMDDGRFVVLLSHRPDIPEEAAGMFDVALTGHTHGGQVWPFGLLSPRIHGMKQGLTVWKAPEGSERTESMIYVSNGAFTWGPPVRFLTPPEIVVVEITKG